MKITPNTASSTILPQSSDPQHQNARPAPPPPFTPDLSKKPAHRKPARRRTNFVAARTPRKDAGGAALGKRTGPATPLLRWKFDEVEDGQRESLNNEVVGDGQKPLAVDVDDGGGRKLRGGKGGGGTVSVRKLAAALWRLQAPDVVDDGAAGGAERRRSRKPEDRLGSMHGTSHNADRLPSHHGSGGFGPEAKDQPRSPCSVNGPINGYICQPQASFKFSNYAMEGVTKWDPLCQKQIEEPNSQLLDEKLNAISTVSAVSALQSELEQARSRIGELESERRSSKKKLEHFLRKLSEERATWRSREHEKVRAIIDDIKADLSRERKNRQRLEIVNSKLVNELAEAKLMAKRYMQDYDKERKARELVEEVCEELAKEIGEDKSEIEALKKECMKIREEVDDERKMLQMAEVWREERVQMKLVDAKVALEEKHSQMSQLIADIEHFLRSKSGALDLKEMKEVESLQHAVASVKIEDIKEFHYDPPKSGDIFSVFEEIAMCETSEREIEPCVTYSPASQASKIHDVSSEIDMLREDKIYRLSNVYGSQTGKIEDDRSGWETVSHLDDQGSIYSPEGSIASVNKIHHRDSNGSGTEWEENKGNESPVTEISEVCSVPSKQSKKVSSISRLWKSGHSDNCKIISVDGMKSGLSNGRISNGSGITSLDLVSHWRSPDKGNPQIGRGMKGCIEWPRVQKNSLKAKLLEARMESQKIQLRQVLKQKI